MADNVDYTKSTDYVSLRRLLEYHKEVVLPAIGTAGKVDDVGYVSGTSFTPLLKSYTADDGETRMRAEIPLAKDSNVTAGLLSNADYTTFTNKLSGIKLGSTDATVDANKIATIPMASLSSTAAGLISNTEYNSFNARYGCYQVGNNAASGTATSPKLTIPLASATLDGVISSDDYKYLSSLKSLISINNGVLEGDADALINTLYDVINFLTEYEEGTTLIALLGDKASLKDDNEFKGFNTFTKTATFADGADIDVEKTVFRVSDITHYEFIPNSLGLGLRYKKSSALDYYTWSFPTQSITLSGVYTWKDSDTTKTGPTATKAKLLECPTITASMFAQTA